MQRSDWVRIYGQSILFALVVLGAGMLSAWLSLPPVLPHTTIVRTPPITPPDWFFWTVWLVNYPSLGIATWLVWQKRRVSCINWAMGWFLAFLLSCLLFLPLTVWVEKTVFTAVMDLIGLLLFGGLLRSYHRVNARTVYWLLPLILWMPFTTALKWWMVALN